MKKSIKISLGGIAFNIDEDAYALLESYLNKLKEHLGATPEAREIVNDIEARASELLLSAIKENESVTLEMVQQVIDTLGNPEQIAGEADEQTQSETYKSSVKKRLYRNPDNAVVAGVAGGLGVYFNVDPLVFRIIFAALVLAQGLGLLIYLVMWIAVPRAESARQKLEMRGEPVTLENIEKNIRKEYEEVKKNLHKHSTSETADKGISLISQLFLWLGRFLEVLAKVIVIIIGVVLIGVALIALVATIGSLFLGGLAIATVFPAFSGLSLGEFLGSTIDLASYAWVSIPVFLIIAIPLVSLVYIGLRMLFRFRSTNGVYGSIAATVWVLSVVTLAIVMFLQARSFTIRESVVDSITLKPSVEATKTLVITASNKYDDEFEDSDNSLNFDEYSLAMVDGAMVVFGRPKVTFEKSDTDDFEMFIERKARGATIVNAKRIAEKISIGYSFTDSTLMLDSYFTLPKGEKWRMQEILITIRVPEGKRVAIDNNVEKILSSNQDYCFCWPDEMVGKTWVMGRNRMTELE